jgi:hypothetical protein
MGISGKIDQITSTNKKAFLNLDFDYGRVEAWGHSYRHPTYILFDGYSWTIKIFDDEEYANEWLKSYDSINCDKIFKLVENGLEEIVIK